MPQTLPPSGNFNKTFWFIVFTCAFGFSYAAAVTFLKIPKDNVHFADITLGFLLGSAVTSGIAYLLGGSPTAPLHPPINTTPGTTTAEVTATITKKEDETVTN